MFPTYTLKGTRIALKKFTLDLTPNVVGTDFYLKRDDVHSCYFDMEIPSLFLHPPPPPPFLHLLPSPPQPLKIWQLKPTVKKIHELSGN